MGIFGKILLVLNILAAGGFGYLAVQDWQGRQNINAAGVRFILVLRGLPLGDKPGDPREMPSDLEAEIPFSILGAGNVPTTTISPVLLKAYFSSVQPTANAEGQVALSTNLPIPNQLAEVRRVYALIKGEIDKRDGVAQKAEASYQWLILQAESIEERSEIQTLRAAGNGDELTRRLFMKFDAVLNDTRPLDVSPFTLTDNPDAESLKDRLTKASDARNLSKDESERRARLAHLLVHLDQNSSWQKRVMLVVGVQRYARTVAQQAIRFQEMAERVERTIFDDQARFSTQYAQERSLAIQRTQAVREMAENRAQIQIQAQKDADLVKQRESQLAEIQEQLRQIKNEVNQLLAKQALTEQALFKVEIAVAETLEDIYRMEADLRRKELEAYGIKK